MAESAKIGGPPCPHCGKEISAGFVAKLVKSTEISMKITPKAGQYIQARTLGESIINFENLLKATAKELGGTCVAFISAVSMTDGGACQFTFRLVQTQKEEKTKL